VLGREWPLLGMAAYHGDVYRICEYNWYPVAVFLGDSDDPIGYVTKSEYELACEGFVPNVPGSIIPRLNRDHFALRKLVGQLIRHPDPTGIYNLTPQSRQAFPGTSAVLRDAGFLREVRYG
jgi:hypothetical protein